MRQVMRLPSSLKLFRDINSAIGFLQNRKVILTHCIENWIGKMIIGALLKRDRPVKLNGPIFMPLNLPNNISAI